MPKNIGRYLNLVWNVKAKHSLYRKDGTWYHVLLRFPGALFDENGYILFKTEEEFNYYRRNYFRGKEEISIPKGISTIPGYIRMNDKKIVEGNSIIDDKTVRSTKKVVSKKEIKSILVREDYY